jgi:hypothetical protein
MDKKSYLEKAKQYQKEKQYHETLYNKHEKPKYHQPELPFEGEKWLHEPEGEPLSDSEVEALFWSKLVQLGWRLNKVENDKLKAIQLMFICRDCGKGLNSQQSHTVTPSRARAMVDVQWLSRVIQKHKTDNLNGCKPLKYDENGEAIAEAIPKATPVFKKTATGKLRIDTIDGETKVFNGERWVPIS